MNTSQLPIPIIDGISQIALGYDAWLCDIWGVMHNGVRPFEGASKACREFRMCGGVVILLTNSPRPSDAVRSQLEEIGVCNSAYDMVVSSGDVARSLVAGRPGRPIFHLGPERDRGIFEGLDIQICGPDDADVVLCSGLYDDETETPADYTELLGRLYERRLSLICANPDIRVERGDKLVYCAGALAEKYKSIGGDVIYTGKPAPAIYELAFKSLETIMRVRVDRRKVLAIGDGLKTDLPGAMAASLDVAFVASALHVNGHHENAALDTFAIEDLLQDLPQLPVAAMARLAW